MLGSRFKLATAVAAFAFAGLVSSGHAAVVATFAPGFAAGTTAFAGAPAVTSNDNANGKTTSSTDTSFAGQAFSGQSFTTGASGFKIDSLAVVLFTGASNSTLSVQVYNVVGTIAGGATGTDGKGTSQNAALGTGLLAAPLSFNVASTNASGIETLDFTGADEAALTLAANTTYYVEIGGLGVPSLVRGQDVYTNGNAYQRANTTDQPFTLFSGATRDAPLAIYAVPAPEPATLAAAAAGVATLARRRRRR